MDKIFNDDHLGIIEFEQRWGDSVVYHKVAMYNSAKTTELEARKAIQMCGKGEPQNIVFMSKEQFENVFLSDEPVNAKQLTQRVYHCDDGETYVFANIKNVRSEWPAEDVTPVNLQAGLMAAGTIWLIAKDSVAGRYFYMLDDGEVVKTYCAPLGDNEKTDIGTLDEFSRLSEGIPTLESVSLYFANFDEFSKFADHDCSPGAHGIKANHVPSNDDALKFASIDIIEKYLDNIPDLIATNPYDGSLKTLFMQIFRCRALWDNTDVLEQTKALYKRFLLV